MRVLGAGGERVVSVEEVGRMFGSGRIGGFMGVEACSFPGRIRVVGASDGV